MKKLFEFKSFVYEGMVNQKDLDLDNQLRSVLQSSFDDVRYYKKDEKYYDYGNGYIHISNVYICRGWSLLDETTSSILKKCNFKALEIWAKITYSESLSENKYKQPSGYIGINKTVGICNRVDFDLNNQEGVKKSVEYFIEKVKKSKITDDIINIFINNWKPITSESSVVDVKDIGIGRHASTNVTEVYNNVFKIKDIDVAFSRSKEDIEKMIKNSIYFKDNSITFDWNKGLMYSKSKNINVLD